MPYSGKTLLHVLGCKTKTDKWDTGIDYIDWIMGSSFTWQQSYFPTHILLYHELSSLEHNGYCVYHKGGMWDLRVSAAAKQAYKSYTLEASRPPK